MSVPIKYIVGEQIGECIYMGNDTKHISPLGQSKRIAQFRCMKCGNVFRSQIDKVKRLHTTSCGCFQKYNQKYGSITHGLSESREYRIWRHIILRCTDIRCEDFPDYGGRGITICENWMQFGNFFNDMGFSPTSKHSIDRKDNSKGYFKENCRWATSIQQNNNRRDNILLTIANETKTMAEWARFYKLNYKTVHRKIKYLKLPLTEIFPIN